MTGFLRFVVKLGLWSSLFAALLLTCTEVPDHCGKGSWYNPKHEFCFNSKPYSRCNSKVYNPLTEGCTEKNEVGTKCLDGTFVPLGTPCGGYTLATAAAPAASGSVSRNPDLPNYIAGTSVTVTATAAEGYKFTGWAGTELTGNPLAITMDSNQTLIALFEQETITPPDPCIANPSLPECQIDPCIANPCAAECSTGPGSACCAINPDHSSCHVPPAVYTLSLIAGTGGTVMPPSGSTNLYNSGTVVNITATANSGYTFSGWTPTTGIANPSSANTTVSMTQNRTVTANFTSQGSGGSGSFTDSRDGKSYRTVRIGTQTWMAENLNYNAIGSTCYNNSPDSCAKYGRLYDWYIVSNAYSSSLNPSGIRGICPAGWHVPSSAEWEALVKYVDPNASGNSNVAGTKLKSKSGWYSSDSYYKAGTDDYGFSALPGGYDGYVGYFYGAGYSGYWWSATAGTGGYNADRALSRKMGYNGEHVYWDYSSMINQFALRCVQD